MSEQERKHSAAIVLETAALEYAASCGQLDAKERAELEALRQMRDGLIGLRDELERELPNGCPMGRTLGEHALVTCYALLSMCGGQR